MKLNDILLMLGNNALDITIDNILLSTKYFKLQLKRYSRLDIAVNDIEEFIYIWETYFESIKDNVKRIYVAMTTDYNPLENYDKQSNITTTNVNTANMSDIKTIDSVAYTENEKTTYNSDTLHLSEKNTAKDSDTTNTINSSSNNNENMIERTHGNIGVVSSQSMLKSEYEVRRIGVYQLLTEWFVGEWCF